MKQLIRKFKQISILILAIFIVGCEEDDATLPQITAGFTYKINLNTGTVTFINISENAQTYEWSFGYDSKTSKEVNPIHTYPTSGTYMVILKAKNASGATNTFESEITFTLIDKVVLPITFDISTVGYDAATFNGASFAIVDNPSVSGTNNKASKVGAITNSGKAFEGINFDLGAPIDLTTEKSIKMNFWADAPVAVLMKLEEGTTSTPDVVVNHTGTGWEEMIFSFTSSSKYSRLTLFVDGPGTKSGTFYFDDVTQILTPAPPCVPEIAQSLLAADFNLTFQAENTTSTIVDGDAVMVRALNPDTNNAVNTSCQVGKITRSPDALYANNQIQFASKLDFNAKAGFKLKVWSEVVGTKVTVKIEDKLLGNTGPFAEKFALTTVAKGWEELTFNFATGDSGKFDRIVLFFNIATNTPGTFYIDDFKLYPRATDAVAPVITLNGSATINVAVGGTFTDPGATAADNVDGNITGSIVVAGDVVDVNTAATYIITYNVSDAAGNAATQKTRTVIVAVGGGGTGTPGELATNGDFETGDVSGWEQFLQTGSSFTASTNNPKSGSFSGNLVADFSAGSGGPVDAVIKQANLLPAQPNTQYVISFDIRGAASVGGVFFVEFFSELSGGGTSKAEIITGGPHPLSDNWTSYSYTVLTGSNVDGGITLQLKSSCGPVGGCLVDVFFDNVSIKLK